MHSSALIHAERAVPRYTSYPTAPHFHAGVGGAEHARWMTELPSDAALSLYLHVPFCTAICGYCGCTTKATRRASPVEAYAERLERELDRVADKIGGRRVIHIAWGGGTPSMLGPNWLERLYRVIEQRFDLDALGEHAIELDPRETDAATVAALAAIGITRASLGVQDFSAHVQTAIGRVQPFGTVERAVDLLRAAGINAINIDLMYGLPHQTERDVRRTVALAHVLAPSRLDLFGYAHVPWIRPNQRTIDERALPGPEERLAQAEAAADKLEGLGYLAIGLDHFARPSDPLAVAAAQGTLKRNFQGYTTDQADALIGLGASAISRLPQGFTQNAPDVGSYKRAIDSGLFATTRGVAFTADDLLRGRLIEALMCNLSVDIGELRRADAGAAGYALLMEEMASLARSGLVDIQGSRITMTREGRPFVRLAAAALDARRQAASHARHSIAV